MERPDPVSRVAVGPHAGRTLTELVAEHGEALLGRLAPTPDGRFPLLLKHLDAHHIPHVIFINKMDRSEVAYRDLLQSLRDLSDRPVVPHQYAIGRGEDLVGYIDLVTARAYSYTEGGPAQGIELPEEYRLMADMRGESSERAVCDYIAGMTDRYAIREHRRIFSLDHF